MTQNDDIEPIARGWNRLVIVFKPHTELYLANISRQSLDHFEKL